MSDLVHSDQVTPFASGLGSLGSPLAIPTSDAGSPSTTSPAISDTSTLPLTKCDCSAVVTLARMRTSSISSPTADGIPVDPNVPNPDPNEPILLPSTRIEASCTVDRATLDAAIDAFYLRLDLQQTVIDRYQSMETALKQQLVRNRQLNDDLQELRTSASPFVQFAKSKYDRLRALYEEEAKRSEPFREALADWINQTALVEHLKSKILQTVRARHAAQEKANREIAGIRKQMDEAGERLVAECDKLSHSLDKANHKKSKYKRIGNQLQEKLRRALKTLSRLQSDLSEAQDSLSARSAECDQLRGIVSDRDVALDQMRIQLADLASERDRAINDHTTLRDRMTSLVTGDSSAEST